MSAPKLGRVAGPLTTVALVVAAAGEAVWRGWGRPEWTAIGLLGSATVTLVALRRTRPLLAMTCFVAAALSGTLVQATLPGPTGRTTGAFVPIIALLLLSYSLTAYGDRRAALLGAPQPVVLIASMDLLEPAAGSAVQGVLFASLIVVGAPMLAGWLASSRGRLLAELRQTEARLAAEHQDQVRKARAQERLRIWERLSAELSDGLAAISRTAGEGAAGADQAEQTARALLAQTRTTVVDLASPAQPELEPAEPDDLDPEIDSVPSESALPWTVLIASATGVATVLPGREDWSAPLPAMLLCALIVAALAATWRWPLAGITVAWAATVTYDRTVADLGSEQTLTLPLLVLATPFLAGWLERRALALAGLTVAVIGAVAVAHRGDYPGVVALAILASLAGIALRGRVLLVEQVRRAHALLDRQRDDELGAKVLEERAALARDVHDAVGHSLTVLALQAGAARRLAATDPSACASAMATVGEVSREAITQLAGGPVDDADLDALVAGACRAGLSLTVSGRPWLAGADHDTRRLVHRIVQEALTNAMRHSPGAPIEVTLGRDQDRLDLRVRNGPAATQRQLAGSGTGLPALQTRITAVGGRLTAGPTPDGGFVVAAELPSPLAADRHYEELSR